MKTIITLIAFILLTADISLAQEKPLKLVSLAPVITADLILLDLENSITANTTYCINSKGVNPKKIGNISTFSTETIISLNPDIVFCGELNNRQKIDKLKAVGIKTVFLPYPKTFKQMCDNLRKIADATGKEKKASALIAKAQNEVNKLKTTADKNAPTVFVQIGADPLFTANKDSYIHELVEFAGGINISKESKSGMYSKEAVIANNPDIILISEMGINGVKEKANWENYSSLLAVKKKNIYIIDEYMLCSPSVIAFPDTLKKIKEIFTNRLK